MYSTIGTYVPCINLKLEYIIHYQNICIKLLETPKQMNIIPFHTQQRRELTLITISEDLNLLKHGILSYLDRICDITNLALTCKYFFNSLYSNDFADLWNSSAVDICIDECCQFGCGRVQIKPSRALRIISAAPIEQLRMHIPFEKIEYLLGAIGAKGTIKRLHLRFRVDQNSIDKYRSSKRFSKVKKDNRCNITHLTVFGWPSVDAHMKKKERIKKLGDICSRILSFVGLKLQSLHFLESSPAYVMKAVAAYCSGLSSLTIEGKQSECGVLMMSSPTLKELCLRDTSIALTKLLPFPCLERLELIDKIHPNIFKSKDDVNKMISSIPTTIREFEIRIDGIYGNVLIRGLASRLHSLEALVIQFSNDNNIDLNAINELSLQRLAEGCSNLFSLEINDGYVDLSSNAVKALVKFSHLRRLTMFYSETLLHHLPFILSHSSSIKEITLLENAEDLYDSDSNDVWNEIESTLQEISRQFPGVTINLLDCWWS